ncbi:cryptochrome [Athelia psychrophila]|uniref:Cryptochrome DASH n=1 Tax=Athelia psychrophila TaxID=1759441 RepID=A0A166GLE4_9AGAM|nr:cryptochrome [Fibularhizoctonia sp. CBS 109695]
MSKGIATEEKAEEGAVRRLAHRLGVEFKLWADESYLIHPKDLLTSPEEVSDVFTSFRKSVEPLRDNVRSPLPIPSKLPPFPADVPEQAEPFVTPASLDDMVSRLKAPMKDLGLSNPPSYPEGAATSHPFRGGETQARARLDHLVQSGTMTNYKDTRNGLLGTDYSTKLSAWLALGCITARQIHSAMYTLEEGSAYTNALGHGKGENKGTTAVRFELLWRDYMALCALKYGADLFSLGGFAHSGQPYNTSEWSLLADQPEAFQRWQEGSTGLGLIDASQRELFLTGYTSNRTRQNVACFLAKDLGIDWRLGAEWYESMLVDYEVASNWGNWQYNAGVGNDPRGVGRKFNPVKQAHDYDMGAKYCRTWLPELRGAERDETVWQAWTLSKAEREKLGVVGLQWVERPLKQISWGKLGKGRKSGKGNKST